MNDTGRIKSVLHPEARSIVFDRPFLLYMERSGAANPYLVIWFENPELFVKSDAKPSSDPPRGEPKK